MVMLAMHTSVNGACLSTAISFLGSYMTICLCEQFRLSRLDHNSTHPKIFTPRKLLFMMSCSLGGVAMWGLHFLEMTSMVVEMPDGSTIHLHFHILTNIISLLFTLAFCGIGLFIASHDALFSKDKREIVQMFMDNSSKLSMKQIQNISSFQIIRIIGTNKLHHLCLGGFFTGGGVITMHYMGMWSVGFEGYIVYDIGIVAASIVEAMIAAIAAFWILFRLLSIYPHLEVLRIASAAIMTLAVCAVHYTGMSATDFRLYENKDIYEDPVQHVFGTTNSKSAFDGALISCIAIVMLLVIMTLADLRAWLYDVMAQLMKSDKFLHDISVNNFSVSAINHYLAKKHDSEYVSESELRSKPSPSPHHSGYKPSPYMSPQHSPRGGPGTVLAGNDGSGTEPNTKHIYNSTSSCGDSTMVGGTTTQSSFLTTKTVVRWSNDASSAHTSNSEKYVADLGVIYETNSVSICSARTDVFTPADVPNVKKTGLKYREMELEAYNSEITESGLNKAEQLV